eukprot:7462504-Pyramimonas_sp.AAC.1
MTVPGAVDQLEPAAVADAGMVARLVRRVAANHREGAGRPLAEGPARTLRRRVGCLSWESPAFAAPATGPGGVDRPSYEGTILLV